MGTVQENTEPFIFKLIRKNIPREEDTAEETQSLSDRLFYLLLALASVAVVAYVFAFGLFSHE
jgi:hypothetical protein